MQREFFSVFLLNFLFSKKLQKVSSKFSNLTAAIPYTRIHKRKQVPINFRFSERFISFMEPFLFIKISCLNVGTFIAGV